MPALDAITLKHQFLQDQQSWIGKRLADSYYRSASKQRTPEEILHFGASAPNDYIASYPTYESWRTRVERDVQMSDAYYVSPEMCVLVTAAAESMPDDAGPRAEDFPSPAGWLLIPNGLVQTDIRGNAVITNVVLWSTVGGVLRLEYLTDKTHPLDRHNTTAGLLHAAREEGHSDPERWARQTWEEMPRLTHWHSMSAELSGRIPQSMSLGNVIPPEVSNQIRVIEGPNGQTALHFPIGYTPDELKEWANSARVGPEPVIRWLLACLRLMQQEITTVTEHGLPANLRRSLKGKVRMKNTHVTVIEYRRISSSMPSESSREYTHRFLRRGHWRWQPYKNEEHEWDRKRIWIHPTIVGDESLPLLLREHVKALVR